MSASSSEITTTVRVSLPSRSSRSSSNRTPGVKRSMLTTRIAAALANFGRRPSAAPAVPEFSLSVRLSLGADPVKLLGPTLDSHLTQVRLQSVTTARQGAALDVAYLVRFRDPAADPVAFVGVLNKVEGVQSVEMRRRQE